MVTIIDYGAGNIKSVERAFAELGVKTLVTADPAQVRKGGKLVFPGVGAAPQAMDNLHRTSLGAVIKQAFAAGTPILGICIGAQVALGSSEEGDTPCLGLIPGKTVRFRLSDPRLKVPHMGWNEVCAVKSHPLLDGIKPGDEFYFVHSYYPQPASLEHVYALSDHGGDFCCAIGLRNLFATQFHPEKSGRLGLQLLERFVKWDGGQRGA